MSFLLISQYSWHHPSKNFFLFTNHPWHCFPHSYPILLFFKHDLSTRDFTPCYYLHTFILSLCYRVPNSCVIAYTFLNFLEAYVPLWNHRFLNRVCSRSHFNRDTLSLVFLTISIQNLLWRPLLHISAVIKWTYKTSSIARQGRTCDLQPKKEEVVTRSNLVEYKIIAWLLTQRHATVIPVMAWMMQKRLIK